MTAPTITRCCPRCGRPLVRRWRGRRPFLGCSGYIEVGCRHTEPLPTDLALRHHPDAVPLPLVFDPERTDD